MKIWRLGLMLLLMAGFMAACSDDGDESNAVLGVRNLTTVDIVVVGYPKNGDGDTFTFQVSPNQTGKVDIDPALNDFYVISIAPAGGGAATQYTHGFYDGEYWQIDYTGVLGGAGGAGDIT